jgi:hypothetical protein
LLSVKERKTKSKKTGENDMVDLALDVKADEAKRVFGQSRELMQWLSSISQ